MSRLHRTIAALTIAALAFAALAVLAGGPAHAADVHGDDGADRYVGTGGLILPASVPAVTRVTVASCRDCAWRLTTPCIEPALGTPFSDQPGCTSVTRGCPGGELLRAWFRGNGSDWRPIGLVCLGPGGPLTVDGVSEAVRDRVERAVPPLRPSAQPPAGVLAQLPVVFVSGQPGGAQEWEMSLPAARVDVRATPRWVWSFGDGGRLSTADPGRRYPVGGIGHVYRAAGVRAVEVTTEWSATFTVAGLGPFPVDEPVRQSAALEIVVGEGRAVLTPPPRHGSAGMAQ